MASIQRGEQKECESDETLSNETDDKRESLLSDNVVEVRHLSSYRRGTSECNRKMCLQSKEQ